MTETPNKYYVHNGWLVFDVGQCNCAGGTIESSYAHEPYCSSEPCATMEELTPALTAAGWLPPDEAKKLKNLANVDIETLARVLHAEFVYPKGEDHSGHWDVFADNYREHARAILSALDGANRA